MIGVLAQKTGVSKRYHEMGGRAVRT